MKDKRKYEMVLDNSAPTYPWFIYKPRASMSNKFVLIFQTCRNNDRLKKETYSWVRQGKQKFKWNINIYLISK